MNFSNLPTYVRQSGFEVLVFTGHIGLSILHLLVFGIADYHPPLTVEMKEELIMTTFYLIVMLFIGLLIDGYKKFRYEESSVHKRVRDVTATVAISLSIVMVLVTLFEFIRFSGIMTLFISIIFFIGGVLFTVILTSDAVTAS